MEEKKSFEKRLEESISIREGDVREAELPNGNSRMIFLTFSSVGARLCVV